MGRISGQLKLIKLIFYFYMVNILFGLTNLKMFMVSLKKLWGSSVLEDMRTLHERVFKHPKCDSETMETISRDLFLIQALIWLYRSVIVSFVALPIASAAGVFDTDESKLSQSETEPRLIIGEPK